MYTPMSAPEEEPQPTTEDITNTLKNEGAETLPIPPSSDSNPHDQNMANGVVSNNIVDQVSIE